MYKELNENVNCVVNTLFPMLLLGKTDNMKDLVEKLEKHEETGMYQFRERRDETNQFDNCLKKIGQG